jgi:NAD(P)-dependent dehydrogenase (short-subunit alcohol dehydrogenase family)
VRVLVEGKVAVVVGVGSGLGREIAVALSEQGARVVLVARNHDYITSVAHELTAADRDAVTVAADISTPAGRTAVIDAVKTQFGGLDALVNVAAHPGDHAGFMDGNIDKWRKTMEVNLWSLLDLTRQCVPLMTGRDGRVVMINAGGSGLSTGREIAPAEQGPPKLFAYQLSKRALAAATTMMAAELAVLGIRVNGVHPGPIGGEHLFDAMQAEADRRGVTYEEVSSEWAHRTPLGYVTPAAEIAQTVVYLCSDLSRPVTGQSIGVQ